MPCFDFFLKECRDIDRRFKTHRVNGSEGVPVEIIDHLDDTTSKTLKRLGRWRMLARLRQEQLEAEIFLHPRRKFSVVLAA